MKPKAVRVDKLHLDQGGYSCEPPQVTIVNPQPRQDGKVLLKIQSLKWVDEAHVRHTPVLDTITGKENRSKRRVHKPDFFLEQSFKSPFVRDTKMQRTKSNGDLDVGVNLITGLTFYNEAEGEFVEMPKRNLSSTLKRGTANKRPKVHHGDNISSIERVESIQSVKNHTIWDLYNDNRFELVSEIQDLLQEEKLQPRATYLGEFFLFCHERQRIWYKKRMNKNKPWTACEILKKVHFSNLFRELDEKTRYFHKAAVDLKETIFQASDDDMTEEQYRRIFIEDILWMSICYRLVNKVETFHLYGKIPFPHEWEDFKKKLCQLKRKKDYTMFTPFHQEIEFDTYIDTIAELLSRERSRLKEVSLAVQNAAAKGDLSECTKIIQKIKNVGKYVAWQITCDLLESKVFENYTENDWVQLGPEANGALSYIFGKDCMLLDIEKMVILLNKQKPIFQLLPILGARAFEEIAFAGRFLSLKSLEHALSEFHKYVTCCRAEDKHVARCYKPFSLNNVSTKCAKCATSLGRKKRVSCNTCTLEFCTDCIGTDNLVSLMCEDCLLFNMTVLV